MCLGGPVVTTNIVGGLGNQLFLLANLLHVASRYKAVWPRLQCVVPPVAFSSSCGPPRPVYWSTLFAQLASGGGVVHGDVPEHYRTVVVPETRPVAPVVLDRSTSVDDVAFVLTGFFQSHLFFDGRTKVAADDGGGNDGSSGHRRVVNGGDALLALVPTNYMDAAQRHLHANYLPAGAEALPEAFHTVAVHVRRGDYLSMPDVFPILKFDYYDAALRTLLGPQLFKASFLAAASCERDTSQRGIAQRGVTTTMDVMFPSSSGLRSCGTQPIRVLIFSEDTAFAKTLAGCWMTKYPGIFATHVDASAEAVPLTLSAEVVDGRGDVAVSPPRDVLELLMMAACDDVVVANSSYSWWGAYWNRRPGRRVVAPVRWFVSDPYPKAAHLYPEDWILL